MTPNIKLLRLVLGHIEMAPCTWDQRNYRTEKECGTAYCFAGWAAVFTGARFGRYSTGRTSADLVAPPGVDVEDIEHWDDIEDYAARVLGLDTAQAGALFFSGNSLAGLHRIVDELCAGVAAA